MNVNVDMMMMTGRIVDIIATIEENLQLLLIDVVVEPADTVSVVVEGVLQEEVVHTPEVLLLAVVV